MIEIPITRRNVTYYKNLGYDVPKIKQRGSYFGNILVKSKDVNKKSKVILLNFKCDNCGKIFQRTPEKYYRRVRDSGSLKTYCIDCHTVGSRETMKSKYGADTWYEIPDAEEKRQKTCIEKYGVPFVQQNKGVREKSRETCLKKYGVESYSQTKEMKAILKENFHKSGIVASSAGQRKIAELVDGELNYLFHGFYLDILYGKNIDIEYDGSGHRMRVKIGKMTDEEFDKQERKRYAVLHSLGIKTITIIGNDKDILPDDDELKKDIFSAIKEIQDNNLKSYKIDYSKLH